MFKVRDKVTNAVYTVYHVTRIDNGRMGFLVYEKGANAWIYRDAQEFIPARKG